MVSYGGHRIGQGKENARQYLKENPAIAKEIEDKIMSIVSGTIQIFVKKMSLNQDGKMSVASKIQRLFS